MKEKHVTVLPPENSPEYPLLRAGKMAEMLALFEGNMGAGGINTLDLPRILCPSGGALNWTIQTLDGDESAKEIEGIVLAWRSSRIYWRRALGEGGGKKPPDCTSTDGLTGTGDPGGDCASCPYAQFGSASKGRGQACKQIRQLLIVRPGEILPYLLSVPPTSLRAASQYFLMLFGKQIDYYGVTTKIRLERTTNDDGISYAKMQFFLGRRLEPAEFAALDPFKAQIKRLLRPLAIEARDYTIVEESAPPMTESTGPDYTPESDDVPF